MINLKLSKKEARLVLDSISFGIQAYGKFEVHPIMTPWDSEKAELLTKSRKRLRRLLRKEPCGRTTGNWCRGAREERMRR